MPALVTSAFRHLPYSRAHPSSVCQVGVVFKEVFDAGEVKREEVFVTSKLWNSEHAPADVKAAVLQTLAELQLEYLDLYVMHWPQAFEKVAGTNRSFPKNEDGSMKYDTTSTHAMTWAAMEALVDEGLVKAIGLSNFNSKQMAVVWEGARIKPANLQVEVHPYFSQEPLIAAARRLGMTVTAYSPLGTGAEIDGNTIPTHPKLAEVGEKYGKSAAQVAIAWQIQRGVIVIPKSVTESRIKQNADVFFRLSDEDMATVNGLNQTKRCGWGGPMVDRGGVMRPRDEAHAEYPFAQGGADIYEPML